MIFAQYLDNHLKDFDQTCSEVRHNGYKSDGLRNSGSYQPKSIKINLNLWMIQYSILGGPHKFLLVCLTLFCDNGAQPVVFRVFNIFGWLPVIQLFPRTSVWRGKPIHFFSSNFRDTLVCVVFRIYNMKIWIIQGVFFIASSMKIGIKSWIFIWF